MNEENPVNAEQQQLRKWIHEMNNRVGVVLASAELLQLEQLSPKANDRTRVIEQKALELRDIIQKVSDHYFGQ